MNTLFTLFLNKTKSLMLDFDIINFLKMFDKKHLKIHKKIV